jgi:hypothetical protein
MTPTSNRLVRIFVFLATLIGTSIVLYMSWDTLMKWFGIPY